MVMLMMCGLTTVCQESGRGLVDGIGRVRFQNACMSLQDRKLVIRAPISSSGGN